MCAKFWFKIINFYWITTKYNMLFLPNYDWPRPFNQKTDMKVAWEVTLPISRTSPISEARTMLRVRHTWRDRPKDWKEKKSDSRNDRSYLQAYSDIGQTDMRTERRRTGWEESKDRVHFLRLYLYQLVSVWNIIILMMII